MISIFDGHRNSSALILFTYSPGEDNGVERMCHESLVDADMDVIESSLYMYISLLSAVVACCPLAKQIFRPRLVSAVFPLLFIHSFTHFLSPVRALSLFAFASCHLCRGAYYIDEFLL